MRAVHALADEAWIPIKENVWVSELHYQPVHWPKAYRYLVRKEKLPQKQQPALIETINLRYHVIVTNRQESAEELVPFHLQRATMENLIRETKYGLSLDSFPCEEFHANWTYLTIGMIAYNLVNWIKNWPFRASIKRSFSRRSAIGFSMWRPGSFTTVVI